jgi:hypothetical protein
MKKRILFSLIIVFCVFTFLSGVVMSQSQTTRKLPDLKVKLPDLKVKFTAPSSAVAGTDIGKQIKLEVVNFGTAVAPGSKPDQKGYMVDLVLSTDTTHPAGWATYKPTFQEDVLLKGGRVSRTENLNPRQIKAYPVGAGIPSDTPTGSYYICARVDPGDKVPELRENNNVFCRRIYIKGKGDNCQVKYPNPRIRYSHTDSVGRVYIPVINWKLYSDEMFRKAPELPPCGLNTESARTWVDIYDATTDNRIYGFCAFDSKDDLKKIWFKPTKKSGKVYIILNDRDCKKKYRSNTISWAQQRSVK